MSAFGVSTYQRPNYLTQDAATYKANIDAMARALERYGTRFYAHQLASGSPAPDLVVALEDGWLWDGTTLTEVAAQNVTGFTIPSAGNERIDRVVINKTTGLASRVVGSVAATGSPGGASPPAVTAGCDPCCQVYIKSTDTVVLNSMIKDERAFSGGSLITGNVPMQFFKWGALNMPAALTRYASGVGIAPNATEANVQIVLTRSMRLKNFRGASNAAINAAQSLACTVRKNGADTALTFTMGAGATTGSDTVDSVDFSAGDKLGIKLISSAGLTATIDFCFAVEAQQINGLNSCGAGQVPMFGSAAGGTVWWGEGFGSATNVNMSFAAVSPFLTLPLTDLYVNEAINSVRTNLSGDSLGLEGAYALAGDKVSILDSYASRALNIQAASIPQVAYDPCPFIMSAVALAQATTQYAGGYGGLGSLTESEVQVPAPAAFVAHASSIKGCASAAMAAGSTVATLRKGGADTAITVTFDNTGRVFSAAGADVSFAAGDLISWKVITGGAVGTKSYHLNMEPAQT